LTGFEIISRWVKLYCRAVCIQGVPLYCLLLLLFLFIYSIRLLDLRLFFPCSNFFVVWIEWSIWVASGVGLYLRPAKGRRRMVKCSEKNRVWIMWILDLSTTEQWTKLKITFGVPNDILRRIKHQYRPAPRETYNFPFQH